MRLVLPPLSHRRSAWGLIILAIVILMAAGCGRKAPPVWLEPTELPAPSVLQLLYSDGNVSIVWDYPDEMMPYIEGFRVETFKGSAFVSSVIIREMSYKAKDTEGYSYRVSVSGRRRGVKAGVSRMIIPSLPEKLMPPSGLSAGMTADGLHIVWDTVENATAYDVYRWPKGESNAREQVGENLKQSEFLDGDSVAGEGKTIMYSVRALRLRDEGGIRTVVTGPASSPVEVDADMFRPAAPTGVAITQSGNKVLVYWDVNPEKWVTGYRVYRVDSDKELHPIARTVTPAYSETLPVNAKAGYAVSAYGKTLEGPISGTVWVKSPSAR